MLGPPESASQLLKNPILDVENLCARGNILVRSKYYLVASMSADMLSDNLHSFIGNFSVCIIVVSKLPTKQSMDYKVTMWFQNINRALDGILCTLTKMFSLNSIQRIFLGPHKFDNESQLLVEFKMVKHILVMLVALLLANKKQITGHSLELS